MPYLWASAVLALHPRRSQLGPTALANLADTAVAHLSHRERFTLYLDWRSWTRPDLRRISEQNAKKIGRQVEHAVQHRMTSAGMTCRVIDQNRFCWAVQFLPADEWHPEPAQDPGPHLDVVCDASFHSASKVRAGIVIQGEPVHIDLSTTGVENSSSAEFLTLCLAVLAGAHQRSPLTVVSDEQEAVRAAGLLREGVMPLWVHRHGSELVQRIAVAAMAGLHLRPVTIRQAPRTQVKAAHNAAADSTQSEYLLLPRTYALRQGIALSWQDGQRGIHGHDGWSKPLFEHRTPGMALY